MFFIVGYPRSRTAWFSYFFTEMGLPCGHDLLGKVKSFEGYKDLVKLVGDSDSGLIYFPNINALFPKAKVVLIERDLDEVMDSLNNRYDSKYAGVKDVMELAFTEFKNTATYLHINYSEINDRLEDIWYYLTDKPFNKEKADELITMNIQEKI